MKRKRMEYSMGDLINRNSEIAHIIIKVPHEFKDMFASEVANEGKSLSYVLRRLMMKYLDEKGVIKYRPEITR